MSRKTVAIDTLKARVNRDLARESGTDEARLAVAYVLESMLHETGNYRGFRYLEVTVDADGKVQIGNETRREYF